jgi:hypothetical protein
MSTTNKPMNTDAQKTAIAVACGWKHIDNDPDLYPYWLAPKGDSRYGNPLDANLFPKAFPDYLNSLNAMYEAGATMNLTDKYQYGKSICKIMNIDTEGGLDVVDIYYACHASAAQRAEAFLRTIGKWEDDK